MTDPDTDLGTLATLDLNEPATAADDASPEAEVSRLFRFGMRIGKIRACSSGFRGRTSPSLSAVETADGVTLPAKIYAH